MTYGSAIIQSVPRMLKNLRIGGLRSPVLTLTKRMRRFGVSWMRLKTRLAFLLRGLAFPAPWLPSRDAAGCHVKIAGPQSDLVGD